MILLEVSSHNVKAQTAALQKRASSRPACAVGRAAAKLWLMSNAGVMVGAAVLPIVFALLWDRCTALGACVGTVFGAGCAISSWLAYAKIAYGEVTVATTGMNYPVLTGSIVSLGMSSLVCVALVSAVCSMQMRVLWPCHCKTHR